MRDTRTTLWAYPAAAAGGVLYFLGFLGFGVWPLLAVFAVPLWWSLETARGFAGAAARGALFGAVAYTGGHLWLFRLVDVFLAGNAGFGALLWALYGLWFAAGFAGYAALYHGLRRAGVGTATAAVAGWLVMEWVHPQLFPVYAGSGLVGVTPLAQAAALGGPLLLTAVVLALDVAVFELARWAAARRSPPRAPLAWSAALLGVALAFGAWRGAAVGERIARAEPLEVGLVQANLGLLEKRTAAEVGHRQHLAQTRELLAEGPLDLVVWPETAYARALRGPLPVAGHLVRGEMEVPLLFGGTLVEYADASPVQTNAALLVAADGMIRDAYRKNLLIPLAEEIPFADRLPGLAERLPRVQQFGAARAVPALALGSHRISVPICYEAVRPRFVRRMVREARPHLLVTLANDAWFGDSQEPLLHLQLARLRAIEHRRFLVRATNSGISAVVDPLGRIVARSGVLSRENLRGRAAWLDGETLYTRLGSWPGPAALVWLAAAVALRPAGRTAPRRDTNPRGRPHSIRGRRAGQRSVRVRWDGQRGGSPCIRQPDEGPTDSCCWWPFRSCSRATGPTATAIRRR